MSIIQDLGDNLVLRHATPADAKPLADFNAYIHKNFGDTEPDTRVGLWTLDLMSGAHPTTQANDFLIVEDTRTGTIASTTSLISQVWKYGGIPFKLGRPELVATNEGYRNKGLVRTQFDLLHKWSAERGELAQAITGIRYYYRQFGYEMTLNMPARRMGYKINIPALKPGETEAYSVRPAVEDDIPFILDLITEADKRYFITLQTDEAIVRYNMRHVNEGSYESAKYHIIVDANSKPIGILTHSNELYGGMLNITQYELIPGMRWAAVSPSVLRYLGKKGEEFEARDKKQAFGAYIFQLGDAHPAYDIISSKVPRKPGTYTYFMRVPDIPAFINHVAPLFEKRIAESVFAGHTGEIKFNFYRSAFKMTFVDGKVGAESYKPAHQDDGDAFFPQHTFLHLLFAHFELEDIERIFPDCFVGNDEARALIKLLFPRQDSFAMPLS